MQLAERTLYSDASPSLLQRSEHVCAELVCAEIDLASALLRIAEMAAVRGSYAQALELIVKARASQKAALRYLATRAAEASEESRDIRRRAEQLFDAIVAAVGRLRESNLPDLS